MDDQWLVPPMIGEEHEIKDVTGTHRWRVLLGNGQVVILAHDSFDGEEVVTMSLRKFRRLVPSK